MCWALQLLEMVLETKIKTRITQGKQVMTILVPLLLVPDNTHNSIYIGFCEVLQLDKKLKLESST